MNLSRDFCIFCQGFCLIFACVRLFLGLCRRYLHHKADTRHMSILLGGNAETIRLFVP